MNDTKRPPDFDWVSERHAYSLQSMFVLLRHLADRDVAKWKEITDSPHGAYLTKPNLVEDFFSVSRRGVAESLTTAFKLTTDYIVVEIPGDKARRFTLTLTDQAECKLRQEGSDVGLDPWQVIRLALEPILF